MNPIVVKWDNLHKEKNIKLCHNIFDLINVETLPQGET